jgi:hypothetical protein
MVRNRGRSRARAAFGTPASGAPGWPGYIEKRPALSGALSWCNVLLENYL